MQFLLYCFCGGIGVSTDYLVYSSALSIGIWYQPANVLGYLSGTLISFFLNRIITFSVKDNMLRRLLIFILVAVVGFLASALMLWLLIDVMAVDPKIVKLLALPDFLFQNQSYKIDPKIAKLLTLPVVVVIQFSLNRSITFKEKIKIKPTDV